MNKPAATKEKEIFARRVAALLFLASFLFAMAMHVSPSPILYWFMWTSIATGVGALLAHALTFALHITYIEQTRTN